MALNNEGLKSGVKAMIKRFGAEFETDQRRWDLSTEETHTKLAQTGAILALTGVQSLYPEKIVCGTPGAKLTITIEWDEADKGDKFQIELEDLTTTSLWTDAQRADKKRAVAAAAAAEPKEPGVSLSKDNVMPVRGCNGCGTRELVQDIFKSCKRCRSVYYCGLDCQKADWKGLSTHAPHAHKLVCGTKLDSEARGGLVSVVVLPGDESVRPYASWIKNDADDHVVCTQLADLVGDGCGKSANRKAYYLPAARANSIDLGKVFVCYAGALGERVQCSFIIQRQILFLEDAVGF
jgi:hypothetical protein